MISLQKVSKVFGLGTPDQVTGLHPLSLRIEEGDFITVIGSNGAGKSTLLNLVAGSYAPTSGHILYQDKDISRQSEFQRARFIGRIFQDPTRGTAANMSVEDNMAICLRKGRHGLRISLNRKTRAMFRDRLQVLGMGLENRMKDNVGLLSGGQRQALCLLMIALSRPKLMLLDEHTAALDPANAEKLTSLTQRFIEEFHLTVLMVTHNMQHAVQMGNRLVMLDQGRIIASFSDEEKQRHTVTSLVNLFRKQHHLVDDSLLLS